jgi:hypothetical protein
MRLQNRFKELKDENEVTDDVMSTQYDFVIDTDDFDAVYIDSAVAEDYLLTDDEMNLSNSEMLELIEYKNINHEFEGNL